MGRAIAWVLTVAATAIGAIAGSAAEPAPRARLASTTRTSLLRLPSGPPGAVPFGAYPTRLAYDPEWDRQWRKGRSADLVVRFDAAEPRFVLWRGTSFVPCWATAEGPWFTSGFFERRGGPASGTTSMVEPMSDKQARYSHYRVLEASDARVVIHWRYAPVDLDYALAFVDEGTGWGDWADELYTIYPDGVAARQATLVTSALDEWLEHQETIVIHPPGAAPEDGLELAALTLANARGESRTYEWTREGGPTLVDPPRGASIEIVRFRSRLRPFTIVPPDGARFASYPGHAPGSHFNVWSHWPVAQERSDTTVGAAPGQPSHTSLSHVTWKPHARDDRSVTWILLEGMTDEPVAGIARLARSWLDPPPLELEPGPCRSRGYDPAQRAYVLECPKAPPPSEVAVELAASDARPLVNPALVIEGWGRARVSLRIDGAAPGPAVARVGYRERLDASDLVVWLRTDATRPLALTLRAEPGRRD